MSSNVVVALIGFGETLQNSNVATKTKLQVLGTLNEVTLTLSELSESGVGRAVSKLKSAPGELGNTARLLVSKWKRLLRDHMAKTSLTLPMPDVEADCEVSTDVGDTGCDISVSKSDQSKKIPTTNDTEKHTVNVKPISDMPTKTRPKTVKTNIVPAHPVRSPSPSSMPSCSHTNSHAPSQTKNDSLAGKRKAPQLPVDSLDSSSGLSFLESLNVGLSNSSSSSCSNRKKSKKPKFVSKSSSASFSPSVPPVQTTSMCPKPSTKFTEEVLSALADEVFDRPDIIHKSVDMAPADASDFEDGDLKFKSKRILWVPKPSRSTNQSCGRGQSGCSPHDPANDTVNPRSLVDLCLDVVEQNLSRVDHVGQVPYELLARTLRHASPEDLARIEHCNPVSSCPYIAMRCFSEHPGASSISI
ncbi:Transcription elongation factor B polypeptide 3 [Paragonimus heterotremus]|uniref:Transcription elongation factor B polypeptide 3 n=1 Tax=Paragonimus heterotremus TaxID=100268 RepID=A0A8J4T0F4_9TREM|nr:Transcription elongation factor B polypeptide 3 [Paragonimus heterotremus]